LDVDISAFQASTPDRLTWSRGDARFALAPGYYISRLRHWEYAASVKANASREYLHRDRSLYRRTAILTRSN